MLFGVIINDRLCACLINLHARLDRFFIVIRTLIKLAAAHIANARLLAEAYWSYGTRPRICGTPGGRSNVLKEHPASASMFKAKSKGAFTLCQYRIQILRLLDRARKPVEHKAFFQIQVMLNSLLD